MGNRQVSTLTVQEDLGINLSITSINTNLCPNQWGMEITMVICRDNNLWNIDIIHNNKMSLYSPLVMTVAVLHKKELSLMLGWVFFGEQNQLVWFKEQSFESVSTKLQILHPHRRLSCLIYKFKPHKCLLTWILLWLSPYIFSGIDDDGKTPFR